MRPTSEQIMFFLPSCFILQGFSTMKYFLSSLLSLFLLSCLLHCFAMTFDFWIVLSHCCRVRLVWLQVGVLSPNPLRSHRHDLRPQGVIHMCLRLLVLVVVVDIDIDDVKGHPIETQ